MGKKVRESENMQKHETELDPPVLLPLNSRTPVKRAEKSKKAKKEMRGRSKTPTKKRRRKQSSSTGSRSCGKCSHSPGVKHKKGITRRSLSCSTSVDKRRKNRSCSRVRS